MANILLINGTVLTHSGFRLADVLIEHQFISKIEKNITPRAQDKVIDCQGKLVLPGLIDAHVHFRQPGMEQKGNIYTESRAAALGGVTSFMDMPNTNPPTTTLDAVENKKNIAQKDSAINYGFYLGAGEDNIEEVKKANPHEIAGIKIYMGSTTGNLLLEDDSKLHKIFKASPTLVATHCEDNSIINDNTKKAKELYQDKIPFSMHPIIRSRDCCIKSSKLAIQIAQDTDTRLHIMHLSTQEEVELMRPFASVKDLTTRLVTGELCIPHMFFNESDYTYLKGFLKCNPAVKYERDRRHLIQGLKNGLITTIGTDHAPHELAVKDGDNYLQVASGVPSIQFSLNVIFDLFKRGEITLEDGIRAATINVAKRFGIKKRGAIKEGYYADIAVLDPRNPYLVHSEDIVSLCQWSPFTNHNFKAQITHTIASGRLVVDEGKLLSDDSFKEHEVCALEFAHFDDIEA